MNRILILSTMVINMVRFDDDGSNVDDGGGDGGAGGGDGGDDGASE